MKPAKDPAILRLLEALPMKENGWEVTADWEADRAAVGIAPSRNPRHLVYVSTWKKPKGRFFYECETPKGPEPGDHTVTDSGEDVDYDTLLAAMTRHLSRAREEE